MDSGRFGLAGARQRSYGRRRPHTEVAAIARVPVEELSTATRLVEDLDLDSMALAEVLALLADDTAVDESQIELWDQDGWTNVTLADLLGASDGD